MQMAGRRSNVHGLVELDVTESRRQIDEHRLAEGGKLSFTAFLVYCLASAIEDHPDVQAYRDWRGRLVRFGAVDAMVMVERTVDGTAMGLPRVLRDVESRSLRSIHDEIRAAKSGANDGRTAAWTSLGLALPAVLRRQFYRLAYLFPARWKQLAGTVGVTSVGMFASGGGWGITPSNYPLNLTVGGIARKPGYVDGELVPREYLDLTVTFDHDVVDGAAATRFVSRLAELVESGHGLSTVEWE